MPAAVPMFMSLGAEKLAAIAIKCLAVAGGYLAGYAIGGAGAWALDKWVFGQKTPEILRKACRTLTGLVGALLVALIVFGDGSGGGLFGGGGSAGDSNGKGSPETTPTTQPDQAKPSTTPPETRPIKVDITKTPTVKPDDPQVRVTFLGGDAVQGDRYYLIDDDQAPKTFDELKAAILKRKEGASRRMFLLVQFPNDPRQRIDENSINVTQVTSWARNTAGLEVVLPGKK